MVPLQIFEKELIIDSKYYKKILQLLKAPSRLIGGSVRDAILGKSNIDIDIATSLLPDQGIETLSQYNIKVIPTGIKFGSVTAIFLGEKFEITSLRKDINCTGRYAEVSFGTDFAEDAKRRDFTMNALSYCPFEHKIYDYFNGMTNLHERKVIFIGNPIERIQEDYLRILRFFRFSSLYAENIDQEGLIACTNLQEGLKTLSKERIKWEMDKLIVSKNANDILNEMFNIGVLQMLFPIKYFDPVYFIKSMDFAKEIHVILEKNTLYAFLFYGAKQIKHVNLINLKFSNQESTKILSILNLLYKTESMNIQFLLKEIWLEYFDEYAQYVIALFGVNKIDLNQANEFISKYNKRLRPKFPISGNDLLKLTITGQDIGKNLTLLKKIWIDTDFTLNKDQLLQMVCNEK